MSVLNLIRTGGDRLRRAEATLWEAYEQGLGIPLPTAYREACYAAWTVTGLVVDAEIARSCGRGPEMLPGLLQGCGSWGRS